MGNTEKMHSFETFVDEQGVQCGYCINGMIMTDKVLLDKNPKPTDAQIKEALAGNLCRCGSPAHRPGGQTGIRPTGVGVPL